MKNKKLLKCRKCKHQWITRLTSGLPVRCPNPKCQVTDPVKVRGKKE